MSTTSTLIQFRLNGEPVARHVEAYNTLVEVVRDCGLHGARESCGQGLCGCCTVVVDGKAVTGCIYPAMHADGCNVATVESLEKDGELDPVQQAFIDAGAFQCGFCTPGFILMSRQLLAQNPDPSEHEIRHYLAGNLCRCGAYPEIIKAVQLAGLRMRAASNANAS
ncbi:(2Fe-2S)-binding protein [Hydrogenophaga sp. BPS33]|uniref:(2Fe-2S)-binding protein n=1 Tax=Hydrogenophaga sp. BPS33 TaxID=2651974 RepID=UPI00131F59E6|nr:(2Fe-2S)-binding protein [Hydrogenophaga sp. BPS33]QHE85746.1 (2Fe-2S)-binding protein [Hydrogenophaga sp. BPS33]